MKLCDVYELAGAQLIDCDDPHICLVEEPREGGPQGCLIVVRPPGRREIWRDALILVPDGVPRSGKIENLTYSAALVLIQTAYRKRHANLLGEFFKKLCTDGVEKCIFAQRKLEVFLDELNKLADSTATPGVHIKQFTDALVESIRNFECSSPVNWTPVELCCDFAANQFKDNWSILQSWEKWHEKEWLCSECAQEFYGSSTVNRSQIDLFRKHLKYLRLDIKLVDRKKIAEEKAALRKSIPQADRTKWQAIREAKRLEKQSFTIK